MHAACSLAEVLARPDIWRGGRLAADLPTLSSGFAALDAELPGGGWPRGTLIEVLSDQIGLGEGALLQPLLRQLHDEQRWALLAAPPHDLHGPAWHGAGVDLTRLAVVAPAQPQDALWAAEQGLTSGALGAVLCWAPVVDARQVRRLQVAATGSNALMFLFRPRRAQHEASAAPLRLLLTPGVGGTLNVRLLKRRGPPSQQVVMLDLPRPAPWRAPSSHSSAASARKVSHAAAHAASLAGLASAASAARSQHPPIVA